MNILDSMFWCNERKNSFDPGMQHLFCLLIAIVQVQAEPKSARVVLSNTGHIFLHTQTHTNSCQSNEDSYKSTNGGEIAYLHTFKDFGQFHTSTKEKEVNVFITVTSSFCDQRSLWQTDVLLLLRESLFIRILAWFHTELQGSRKVSTGHCYFCKQNKMDPVRQKVKTPLESRHVHAPPRHMNVIMGLVLMVGLGSSLCSVCTTSRNLCREKQQGRGFDITKHISDEWDKQLPGSPRRQTWRSRLESGCVHVQSERIHPHPGDTDTRHTWGHLWPSLPLWAWVSLLAPNSAFYL